MAKRAILVMKTVGYGKGPDGSLVNVQKDVTKVLELEITLREVMEIAADKHVDGVTIIFETEDPDIRKPQIVK